jgi:glucose dehydrogenase
MLTSIDVKAKTKILWRRKTEDSLIGGVLAAPGGLVFTGERQRDLLEFDTKTGERLWGFNGGPRVNPPPVSSAVDGKQYVVAAGGNSRLGPRPRGTVVVFGLADWWRTVRSKELPLALIVTPSKTENDMNYGFAAKARF